MEEFLRWALMIGGGGLLLLLAGPWLLRITGGVITILALLGILVKAPADATVGAVITGCLLWGAGTWWRARRIKADQRDPLGHRDDALAKPNPEASDFTPTTAKR